ncbi:MAG: hypothetical protein IT382_11365, partial [Deltaproteobacteria bacterium]|nr:hypothetical protein [Deltaproteobacteria bacterium]
MRISLKILLVTLLVAVVPVAVSGVTSVVLARNAVALAAADKLEAEARHLAEVSETTIIGGLEDLRQAANLGVHTLSNDEIAGALWVIYRGDAARSAVALIDGETGEAVVEPVFQEVVAADSGMADHEAFPASAVEAFAQHVPLADALAAGKAVSVPYADAARGAPLIALAVRIPGRKDATGKERPWVVAVEMSLRALNQRFEEAADERFTAALVDLEGRAVCHTEKAAALERRPVTTAAARRLADPKAPASAALDEGPDTPLLAAYARASRLASPDGKTWGVVVERDRADALAAVEALSRRTLFWVATALILALVAGSVLARGIARPVERL